MSLQYADSIGVWESLKQSLYNPVHRINLYDWPLFQNVMGGLRMGEITLICAPTGAGKTSLLASISAQIWLQRIPQMVAPVETGPEDYMARIISMFVEKRIDSSEHHRMDEIAEVEKRILELEPYRDLLNITTYRDRVDVDEMIAMIKHIRNTRGVQIAILDNLNFFLKVVPGQNEKMEMDNAIHKFVMLVRNIPIHTILVVHPRKTDDGKVRSEFDIKGSSTAVQECDNVLLFNRPDVDDLRAGRTITQRELVFKKLRKRGEHYGKKIWFDYKKYRYVEVVR